MSSSSPSGLAGRQRGFSLLELSIVVVILGAAAATGMAVLRSVDPERVEGVAGEIANALRYARSEAMRHAEHRAVWVGIDENRVGVFLAGLSGGGDSVAGPPVKHPVDRKPWIFDLDELPMARTVRFSSGTAPFLFAGLGTPREVVVFDEFGLPGVWEGAIYHPLVFSSLSLACGDHERSVVLTPAGRISVE